MDIDEKIFGKKPPLVKRLPTGINELDWLYGISQKGSNHTWGMPAGKISVWAGISGVGKSRIGKATAKSIFNKHGNQNVNIVKYFSLEEDYNTPDSLSEILKIVRKNKNFVVFIDSINMLKEFGIGQDANIKDIIHQVRQVCNELKTHFIFISQLNKEGDPRGSTTFPHLVDMVFEITDVKSHIKKGDRPDYLRSVVDFKIDDCVCFSVGEKNRCGRTGDKFRIIWKHDDSDVRIWSHNRQFDMRWQFTETEDAKKFWIPYHEAQIKIDKEIKKKERQANIKMFWASLFNKG